MGPTAQRFRRSSPPCERGSRAAASSGGPGFPPARERRVRFWQKRGSLLLRFHRRPRASGGPGQRPRAVALGSRLRGNDGEPVRVASIAPPRASGGPGQRPRCGSGFPPARERRVRFWQKRGSLLLRFHRRPRASGGPGPRARYCALWASGGSGFPPARERRGTGSRGFNSVAPAQAGAQGSGRDRWLWVPACAGTTDRGDRSHLSG